MDIRTLTSQDLPRLVAMDEAVTGRRRQRWYREALARSSGGIAMGLGAEVDGVLVGALLAAVRYGEFGVPEPVAEVDTLVIDPRYRRQGVGNALMEALVLNLGALRVERVRTQIDWGEQDLLGFLARSGFAPTTRLVLERRIGGDA